MADLLNLGGIVYSLVFAAYVLPTTRAAGTSVGTKWIVVQAVAVAYTTLVYPRVQGRLVKSKWKKEQVTRTQAVSLALNGLAAGAQAGKFGQVEMSQIEHRLLQAVASEVETLFQDAEGIYFAVCLQVLKRSDSSTMVVLNRSNLDRDTGVTYRTEELLASTAMNTGRRAYNPNYVSPPGRPEKPYKSIFALPILFTDSQKVSRALGAISVDSARAHHFDGYEQQLEILLQPYLGLLALVLVCRDVCNVWPEAAR